MTHRDDRLRTVFIVDADPHGLLIQMRERRRKQKERRDALGRAAFALVIVWLVFACAAFIWMFVSVLLLMFGAGQVVPA